MPINVRKVVKPRKVYEEPEEIDTLIAVEELSAYIRENPLPMGAFTPSAFYNREGDMMEAYFENESCYAEAVGIIVIERAHSDNRIVGVKVCQVKSLMGLKEIK